MADSTISQLPSALTISPVDFFAVDQGGVTKKATLALLGSNTVFVAAGKIFTVNNTLTLAGTDGTTMTFPSTNASLARTDAAQTFTGLQTFTDGITTPAQVTSTIATGTPPLVVSSTTPVANLSIGGNAATVTTNANLTGMVTSLGNATTVVTNANLTGMVTSVGNATTVVTNANLTGEVTSVGNATTVLNATVIDKVLTGFVSGAGVVAATDTILQAVDKLDGNVAARALLAGSAAQVFSVAPATAATHAVPLSQTTGRNKYVNGEYKVSQVNLDAAHTITAGAAIDYGIDCWYTQSTGQNITAQRIAGTAPFRYAYKLLAGATGPTTTLHGQRIAGKDVACFESSNVVVSVGIICDVPRTVTWTAYYATVEDTFSTKTQIATGSISAIASQANYSFTFNAGANAKLGLCIEYTTGALTNSTGFITYTGHQIESGVSPTAYEYCSYRKTLADAQRYLRLVCLTGGQISTTSGAIFAIFPEMFSIPLVTNMTSLYIETIGTVTSPVVVNTTLTTNTFVRMAVSFSAVVDTRYPMFSNTDIRLSAPL